MLQCVAVFCRVVQCGAVWCSVVQCVAAACMTPMHCIQIKIQQDSLSNRYLCRSVLQCVAVCCSVVQCVAVRCSVLQHNAQILARDSFRAQKKKIPEKQRRISQKIKSLKSSAGFLKC